MAPTVAQVEQQTDLIIGFLMEDDEAETTFYHGEIEADGADGDANDDVNFDPALIADSLKRIAARLNDDVQFQAALRELKTAAAQEAAVTAFSHGVDAFCRMHVSAEVAHEMQLIKAAVSFGLYIKNSAPELKTKVKKAMTAFLNMRVGTWVVQQGGWYKVAYA